MRTSPDPFAPLAFPSLGAATVDLDAVERGYAAGLARGRARADRERTELLARIEAEAAAQAASAERRTAAAVQTLEAAAAALFAQVAPVIADAERALAAAALELASAIVGAELARDPVGVARSVLEAVLSHPEAADLIAVRLHPAAVSAVGGTTGGAAARTGVRLVPDPTLRPGDAVGVLPDGLLDATIDGALARARRALLEDAG